MLFRQILRFSRKIPESILQIQQHQRRKAAHQTGDLPRNEALFIKYRRNDKDQDHLAAGQHREEHRAGHHTDDDHDQQIGGAVTEAFCCSIQAALPQHRQKGLALKNDRKHYQRHKTDEQRRHHKVAVLYPAEAVLLGVLHYRTHAVADKRHRDEEKPLAADLLFLRALAFIADKEQRYQQKGDADAFQKTHRFVPEQKPIHGRNDERIGQNERTDGQRAGFDGKDGSCNGCGVGRGKAQRIGQDLGGDAQILCGEQEKQ